MTDSSILWPEPGVSSWIFWGWLAGRLGIKTPVPRPFLLGIRGVAPRADSTHPVVSAPRYDDTFVFFDSGESALPPFLFAGSSHAYQRDSKLSPDRDGDGRGDVGMIRTGRYVLTLALEKPYPIFTVTTPDGSGNVPCYADLDHSGDISGPEKQEAIAARSGLQVNASGYYSTAVLMHTGWDAPPDSEHRSSISCQTASAHDLVSLAGLAKRTGGKIDYLLVDAEEAIGAMKESPYADHSPRDQA